MLKASQEIKKRNVLKDFTNTSIESTRQDIQLMSLLVDNSFLLTQMLRESEAIGNPSKATCGTDMSNIKAW